MIRVCPLLVTVLILAPASRSHAQWTIEMQYTAPTGLSGLCWRAPLPGEAPTWLPRCLWTRPAIEKAPSWRSYLPICGSVYVEPPWVPFVLDARYLGFAYDGNGGSIAAGRQAVDEDTQIWRVVGALQDPAAPIGIPGITEKWSFPAQDWAARGVLHLMYSSYDEESPLDVPLTAIPISSGLSILSFGETWPDIDFGIFTIEY